MAAVSHAREAFLHALDLLGVYLDVKEGELVTEKLLTSNFWLANSAKVGGILVLVGSDLVISLAKAEWVHPLAAGTFALEHSEAWAILFGVVGASAEAVDCLTGCLLRLVRHPLLLVDQKHLVFQANKVFTLLRTVHIPSRTYQQFGQDQGISCSELTCLSRFCSSSANMVATGMQIRHSLQSLLSSQH